MFGREILTATSPVSLTFAISGCSGVISTDVYKYYPVTLSGYAGDRDLCCLHGANSETRVT